MEQTNSLAEFTADVWLWPGEAAWHFISLPADLSADIKAAYQGLTRGWGSLPVDVTIGNTSWKTSIFPDRTSGCYMLPIKAAVRKAEGIHESSRVSLQLTIVAEST